MIWILRKIQVHLMTHQMKIYLIVSDGDGAEGGEEDPLAGDDTGAEAPQDSEADAKRKKEI